MVAPLDHIFRQEWGRVLATLIGFLGDFDLAEEAAQEAFAIAAQRWPHDGVPSNPRAWLMTTARNRATDSIRRERALAAKALIKLLAAANCADVAMNTTTFTDERLELIFTCCHPALAVEAQVALTLRTLGGLTTDEIARAFLVPEQTMAKRLVRAKQKIKAARIPFRVPPAHLLRERLDRQRRVAAREDELKALVRESCRVHRYVSTIGRGEEAGFRGEGPLAADGVCSSVPSRRH